MKPQASRRVQNTCLILPASVAEKPQPAFMAATAIALSCEWFNRVMLITEDSSQEF
jgi:hypothetical protein